MIDVISSPVALGAMKDTLLQTAFKEGFLSNQHLAIDATHFESRDASIPSEKKESPTKKHGRKTKENLAVLLAKQAEIEAYQTIYEKKMRH